MPGRVTEGVRQCAGVYVQHSFYVGYTCDGAVWGDIDPGIFFKQQNTSENGRGPRRRDPRRSYVNDEAGLSPLRLLLLMLRFVALAFACRLCLVTGDVEFDPTVPVLTCTNGTLSPPSFECRKACIVSQQIDNVDGDPCREGWRIRHGSYCTPVCAHHHLVSKGTATPTSRSGSGFAATVSIYLTNSGSG
jgi:hypothetical protein